MPKRLRKPSHPGEILKQHYLVPRGVSQKRLAESIGVSEKHLSQIINGHRRLEADVAVRIAKALETTTDFWLNLQKASDVWDAKEMQDNVCCKVSEPIINVFDTLGFDNPEIMQAKADIAHAISSIIRHRHLTQKEAAKILGTTQRRVSAVMHGRLSRLSLERLIALINKLDCNVEMRIRKEPQLDSNHPNIGSTFDSLLQDDGVLVDVSATAAKRVLAMRLQHAFDESGLTKAAVLKRMGASYATLNRLLDPNDAGVTLRHIFAVAHALKLQVSISVDKDET